MGIDSLQPLQCCNPVADIKKEFGDKIVLSGAINSQGVLEQPNATEEEIRAEIDRALDEMAPGGGYVALVPIINPHVAEIVIDEVSTYGASFYQR
jgi:uroporphyrinogen decarboxylase